MARLVTPNSLKFLDALVELAAQLEQPPNAMQIANRVRLDERETSRCMVELLGERMIMYADDPFETSMNPFRDDAGLLIKRRGQEALGIA